MNFFDRFKMGNMVSPRDEKTVSERYPSASPDLVQYLEFKEGKISLEDLSDKALIIAYKEKIKIYKDIFSIPYIGILKAHNIWGKRGGYRPQKIKMGREAQCFF